MRRIGRTSSLHPCLRLAPSDQHRIEQANIDRYNLLLESESDPTKRAMILRLLAEEKDKLAKPEARKAY
jgi:hypothetical protein